VTWDPITQPIDYILLSGRRSPGLCELSGLGAPRRYDERNGYGLSGATVIFRGVGLSKFSAKIRLYDFNDWQLWDLWKPLIQKPPVGTRPRALSIWHPLCEDNDIDKVVVEDVLGPDQTDDGEFTFEIKFIQFRSPVFKLAKPDGAAATPTDPDEVLIGQLTDQYQNLAKQ
jgi:hypothetical protein